MADVEDVISALADLAVAALYPAGTGLPSATGDAILIYPGWPSAVQLETDLVAGKAHVSVFPMDAERNTTRYSPQESDVVSIPDPHISVSVLGTTSFTLAGAVAPDENVAVLVNRASGGATVVHHTAAGETLAVVAQSLATQLTTAGHPATASGPTVTFSPTVTTLEVRLGTIGTAVRELRRQERWVEVILWANHPDQRSRIGKVLDVALSVPNFLPMPDGTGARLEYRGSPFVDRFEKEDVFRRDWRLVVEYGTTVTEQFPQIVVPQIVTDGSVACL